MPNHVTNVLKITGTDNQIKVALLGLLDEDGNVNFNKSFPIPKELKGTTSPVRILTQKEYDEQEEKIANGNTSFSRGITKKIEKDLLEKYGYTNWYDWQINTWGTKWNAYEQKTIGDNIYQFDTAWSTPFNFFEKLSQLFPEVIFEIKYADEDMGYNVGEYHLQNGEMVQSNQPEGGSIEAYRMALELQGGEDSWMLTDFLIDDIDEEDVEGFVDGAKEDSKAFESLAIKLAYEFEKCDENYPTAITQYLLDRAVEDENYDYASKLRDSMKVKE